MSQNGRYIPPDIKSLWMGLGLSVVCIAFFAFDVLGDLVLGGEIFSGSLHVILETLVVLVAVIAFLFQSHALARFSAHHRRIEDQMRIASGEFSDVIEDYFRDWALSAAERDVAVYLLKGLSLQAIADLRQSKLGTVKAQCNAVYHKAGVTGRHDLIAFLFDELLEGATRKDEVAAE